MTTPEQLDAAVFRLQGARRFVPTQFVGLAIEQLLALATRGVFLSVMLKEDRLGVFVGKPLHQTVRPYRWWRETCAELGRVTDARDLGVWCFLVEPAR